MRSRTLVFLLFALLTCAEALAQDSTGVATPPAPTPAQRGVTDRNAIPGTYQIGLYADERGTSREVVLEGDQETFEMWIGVSGDSTRTFSGLAMALELTTGVELAGPVRWEPRPGLKQSGSLVGIGMELNTPHECATQKGNLPVILGRVEVRMEPGVMEATLTPVRHRDYGLSIELCRPDLGWPKPYAEALPLEVRRKQSLWDRLTGWMR